MIRVYLFLCVLVIGADLSAQSFYAVRRPRNLILNVGSGSATYKGELVNPNQLGKTRYNIVAGAEYYLGRRIATRVELSYFRLAGNDATANDDRVERNLSFFSGNLELSAVGIFNLWPMQEKYYQRPSFNIYGFAGIGILYTNPKTEYKGEKIALQPVQTENISYSRFQPVIPYGVGGKVKISPFFNVALEGGYRITFTDYLDDISSNRYVDPALLQSDLARALSDRRKELNPNYSAPFSVGRRGNPNNMDGYLLINLKVQYYFPKEVFNNSQRKLYTKKRKAYNRPKKR